MAAYMCARTFRKATVLSQLSPLSTRVSLFQLQRYSSTYTNQYNLTRHASPGFDLMKRLSNPVGAACTKSMVFRTVSSTTCALSKADLDFPLNARIVTSGNILIVTDSGGKKPDDFKDFVKSNINGVVEVVDFPDMNSQNEKDKVFYVVLQKPSFLTNIWKKKVLKGYPVRMVRVVAEKVPSKITREDLCSHFFQFGGVHNIMPTASPSRHNSWVIDFADEAGASAATENKTHSLHGVTFSVENDTRLKNTVRRKQTDNYDAQVKVSKLPPDVGVDEIRTALDKYGQIMAVDLDVTIGDSASSLSAWVTFIKSSVINEDILKDKICVSGQTIKVRRAYDVGMLKTSKENELLINNLPVESNTSRIQEYFRQFGDYYKCKKISEGAYVIMFKNHRNMKYFGGDGTLNFYGTEIKVKRMGWRVSSMCNIPTTKTLLLGDLPAETEVDTLVEFLKSFGALKCVNMVLFDKGFRRPRAFVEYHSLAGSVGEMLLAFKKAFGDIYMRAVSPYSGIHDRSNRLVIVDYPDNVSQDMVCSYLSQFGSLKHVNARKESKATKRVYYVAFENSAAVENMRKHGEHFMEGQELSIYYLHWSPDLNLE